jgi:hypothetical protein
MITCPLCQEPVYTGNPIANKILKSLGHLKPLEDGDTQDFDCLRSHYYRRTLQGCFPEYTLHMSPFHFSWLEGLNELRIYSEFASSNSPIKFVKADFQEMVRWIHKMNSLKVFA